jgi:hypothetical protein
MRTSWVFAAGAAALAMMPAQAADFSFTGSFTRDDDVQIFSFDVGATSLVTFRTLSYAGGVNAAGQTIERGGFDPILALFDASGALLGTNDDGASGTVPIDPVTDRAYDTFLQRSLGPGTYRVSVMQYDNFPAGSNLSEGFTRTGEGNFTTAFDCPDNQPAFNDVSETEGCGRTANWAFDILNVSAATQQPGIPEPATWAMMIAGFAMSGAAMRRRAKLVAA